MLLIYTPFASYLFFDLKTLLPSWPARLSLLDSTTVMQCYTEPRAKMPTVYSASRIHLRESCAMHHTAVHLNRFVKRYIGCRSINEFSTRLLWWLTRFDFINNHSIYMYSSTSTCLLAAVFKQYFINSPIEKNCNSCYPLYCRHYRWRIMAPLTNNNDIDIHSMCHIHYKKIHSRKVNIYLTSSQLLCGYTR